MEKNKFITKNELCCNLNQKYIKENKKKYLKLETKILRTIKTTYTNLYTIYVLKKKELNK